MPQFFVEVLEIHKQTICVEAENEDAARQAANQVIESGIQQNGADLNDEAVYERTVPQDEWRVWQ